MDLRGASDSGMPKIFIKNLWEEKKLQRFSPFRAMSHRMGGNVKEKNEKVSRRIRRKSSRQEEN
jgi:hypothetical protein